MPIPNAVDCLDVLQRYCWLAKCYTLPSGSLEPTSSDDNSATSVETFHFMEGQNSQQQAS